MSGKDKPEVRSRGEQFSRRTPTSIWREVPASGNPYLAESCRCRGYDLVALLEKRSFVDVLYLLFRGELPTTSQARLLEGLMIGCINPGPRYPATRAAMNAGVARTHTAHILPIGLQAAGGAHLGGGEVISAMRFFLANREHDPVSLAKRALESTPPESGDRHPLPGFGTRFGGRDPMPAQLARHLMSCSEDTTTLQWGEHLVSALDSSPVGWLNTGVVAATLTDLGFEPREGAGLFQLLVAPGLLAHGLELANKPVTSMPFLDEEHYLIDEQARKT